MSGADGAALRRRAFRAADGFALEAWRASRRLSGDDRTALAEGIRRRVGGAGAALVAATASEAGSPDERSRVASAREALLEARYLLYLARRLGALDLSTYRRLTAAHDGADRDLSVLVRARPAG